MQTLAFSTREEFSLWLEKNYSLEEGIWLRMYKKGSGIQTITYEEALQEALCYGWIDGQLNKLDEVSYIQKFTPRRKRSTWSKKNIERVENLIREGRMKQPGMDQVNAAKADGRWDAAYDSSSNMQMPEDFMAELMKNPAAFKFFETLDKTNRFAIAWRLQTARTPELREKRMTQLLEMLSQGRKLH